MSATTVAIPAPPLFDQARLAVAGFSARYSGPTRTAYTTDLRQYFSWCADQHLDVFAARRGRYGAPVDRPAHSVDSALTTCNPTRHQLCRFVGQ